MRLPLERLPARKERNEESTFECYIDRIASFPLILLTLVNAYILGKAGHGALFIP